MTVADLITKLQAMPPEMLVCFDDEESWYQEVGTVVIAEWCHEVDYEEYLTEPVVVLST